MTDPASDVQTVEARLKAITDYVQDCERRVRRGEIMDLQGLDDNVVVICNDVAELPRTESRQLEDKMQRLIDRLDDLAEAMRTQQQKFVAGGPGG